MKLYPSAIDFVNGEESTTDEGGPHSPANFLPLCSEPVSVVLAAVKDEVALLIKRVAGNDEAENIQGPLQ